MQRVIHQSKINFGTITMALTLNLGIRFTLAIIFLTLFVISMIKLAEKQSGSKTYIGPASTEYPAIAICPTSYNRK